MPNFTGPFSVGTTVLEVVNYSRQDMRAPTPRPRDLAFSMFYPVDNCGDSIVEYLYGRVAYEIPYDGSQEEEDQRAAENVDIHAADLISALNALENPTVTAQIPGFSSLAAIIRLPPTRLRTDKVGVLGHSLGGATALRVTANDTRFADGVGMDGGF
ncbi:hypothetical protein GGR53DRAFT_468332 [Hypoxylon sp. FL1150]|nr:hypothetical protein GGR53DRAFT_468332 [Hypoxylon sp. FL1150]